MDKNFIENIERAFFDKNPNPLLGLFSKRDIGGLEEEFLNDQLKNANLIGKYQDLLQIVREAKVKVVEPFNFIENEIIDKIKKLRNG